MTGGGTQQPQSYTIGGNTYQGGNSSPNNTQSAQGYAPYQGAYYSNPYVNIFSNLSQMQQNQAAQLQNQVATPQASPTPTTQQVNPAAAAPQAVTPQAYTQDQINQIATVNQPAQQPAPGFTQNQINQTAGANPAPAPFDINAAANTPAIPQAVSAPVPTVAATPAKLGLMTGMNQGQLQRSGINMNQAQKLGYYTRS